MTNEEIIKKAEEKIATELEEYKLKKIYDLKKEIANLKSQIEAKEKEIKAKEAEIERVAGLEEIEKFKVLENNYLVFRFGEHFSNIKPLTIREHRDSLFLNKTTNMVYSHGTGNPMLDNRYFTPLTISKSIDWTGSSQINY